MSVTFSIEQERTGWIHECGCGQTASVQPFESYVDAYATLALIAPCDDPYCAMYAPFVKGTRTEADALEINLANSNARKLLTDLGFSTIDEDGELDLCGSAEGEDLLGRALLASALMGHDLGMPDAISTNPGGAVFIEGGRHEGYFDERYEQIAELAKWAQAHASKVVWS